VDAFHGEDRRRVVIADGWPVVTGLV